MWVMSKSRPSCATTPTCYFTQTQQVNQTTQFQSIWLVKCLQATTILQRKIWALCITSSKIFWMQIFLKITLLKTWPLGRLTLTSSNSKRLSKKISSTWRLRRCFIKPREHWISTKTMLSSTPRSRMMKSSWNWGLTRRLSKYTRQRRAQ